jgi:CRP-like cAMP-binding protein
MPAKPSASPRNALLAALSARDFGLLAPNLRRVSLPLRHELEKPNKRIDEVYFMDEGIASVVAVQKGERVEVGLIGWEGMSGTSILLGNDRSPHSTYIQVAGSAQQVSAENLRKATRASASLKETLLRYVQAFMVQTAHTAIANARAKLDRRLARWLLMAHDRVRNDTLPLTHEFVAVMLGVRRAGVTEALHTLSSQGFINPSRGEIRVLNRKGLEKTAGESYGVPEAELRRLLS